MCESPESLQELCLEAVCSNLSYYVKIHYVTENREIPSKSESSDDNSDLWDAEYVRKYRFRDPDVFLINEVSEKLLEKFIDNRMICDSLLHIFTERNTKLKKVKINNCKVTKLGLSILNEHKITDIECINIKKVSIGDILDILNDWTLTHLVSANFSRCSFIDCLRHNLVVKLTRLKSIRSLNISCTELSQQGLEIICQDLTLLEKLDISGTLVKSLEPLLLLSKQLTSLSISDLHTIDNLPTTVLQLTGLRHLDISLCNEKIEYDRLANQYPVTQILMHTDALPNLVSLDVSGWRGVSNERLLSKYIKAHPKLEYLGLVLNDLTFSRTFTDPTHPDYFDNLIIAGLGTNDQIKVTLKRYIDRAQYIQKALYYLFQQTNSFEDARPDMFKLVLPVMRLHNRRFGVQMAATACLYNLTRGDLSKQIHPQLLTRAVELTLDAMAMFPEEFQLQKNSLLTLCSDRILQEVSFNRFRCAKLVLDSLCNFDDINMNRMAVAICSILAAKISTEETSKLGARPLYMKKLLALVRNRVDTKISDITLKFTLSALWNLTDESAATCEVFLKENGALLFLEVLKTFKEDSAVETKILGLLNNIAEVQSLRDHLMIEDLMGELFNLLKSENIDVSYFAAGIVAHLASDSFDTWTIERHSREDILRELMNAVSNWEVPESEMVAYRSFKPFFPLLRTYVDYQVQLWALWAIHHVCSKNPKRYCSMLKDEDGHVLIVELLDKDNHPSILKMIVKILERLEENA